MFSRVYSLLFTDLLGGHTEAGTLGCTVRRASAKASMDLVFNLFRREEPAEPPSSPPQLTPPGTKLDLEGLCEDLSALQKGFDDARADVLKLSHKLLDQARRANTLDELLTRWEVNHPLPEVAIDDEAPQGPAHGGAARYAPSIDTDTLLGLTGGSPTTQPDATNAAARKRPSADEDRPNKRQRRGDTTPINASSTEEA